MRNAVAKANTACIVNVHFDKKNPFNTMIINALSFWHVLSYNRYNNKTATSKY